MPRHDDAPPNVLEGIRFLERWPAGGGHCYHYICAKNGHREVMHYVYSVCQGGCDRHTRPSPIIWVDQIYNPQTRRHESVERPQFYSRDNVRLQMSETAKFASKLATHEVRKLEENLRKYNAWYRRFVRSWIPGFPKHTFKNFG